MSTQEYRNDCWIELHRKVRREILRTLDLLGFTCRLDKERTHGKSFWRYGNQTRGLPILSLYWCRSTVKPELSGVVLMSCTMLFFLKKLYFFIYILLGEYCGYKFLGKSGNLYRKLTLEFTLGP